MSFSSALATFRATYAFNPIIMTGGLADNVVGGALSVASLVNALFGPDTVEFAYYQPLPGGTLIDQQIGMYPFANQFVAANATIVEPNSISMLMICPVGEGGYPLKLVQITSLQQAFKQHNAQGGLYTVMTPGAVYTNCVMTSMTDVSSTNTKQVQNAFKIDFLQPLITKQDADQAQNSLMSQITNGTATDGNQSNPNNTVGSTIGATSGTFVPSAAQGGAVSPGTLPLVN